MTGTSNIKKSTNSTHFYPNWIPLTFQSLSKILNFTYEITVYSNYESLLFDLKNGKIDFFLAISVSI